MALTAIERFISPIGVPVAVSRPSLYTRNSSLPGRYSHLSRTLEDIVSALALTWTSPVTDSRGVGVTMKRLVRSLAVKDPYGRSTQFSVTDGSTANCGTNPIRPL